MTTEQLKLILETFRAMGAAGQEAFIWWLIATEVMPLVTWLLTFAGILVAVRYCIRLALANSLGNQVRRMLDIRAADPLGPCDAEATLTRVRQLLATEAAHKAAQRAAAQKDRS